MLLVEASQDDEPIESLQKIFCQDPGNAERHQMVSRHAQISCVCLRIVQKNSYIEVTTKLSKSKPIRRPSGPPQEHVIISEQPIGSTPVGKKILREQKSGRGAPAGLACSLQLISRNARPALEERVTSSQSPPRFSEEVSRQCHRANGSQRTNRTWDA